MFEIEDRTAVVLELTGAHVELKTHILELLVLNLQGLLFGAYVAAEQFLTLLESLNFGLKVLG